MTLAASLALAVFAATGASAAQYSVMYATGDTTSSCSLITTGNFACPSLRAAVMASNAAGGSNSIGLYVGHFVLAIPPSGADDASTGDLNITDNVVISGGGPNATVIDANGLDRAFDVANGASLTLAHLRVANGTTTSNSGGGEGGGAIEANASGAVMADNVVFSGNTASAGNGGAIDSQGGAIAIMSSTISGNTATNGSGGAIHADSPAALSIAGSTISSNTTTGAGGGGAIALATGAADTTITNTTVADNATAGSGGGLYANIGTGNLTITNATIVDDTSSAGGGGNIRALGGGTGAIRIQNSIVGGGVGGASPSNCNLTSNQTDVGSNLFFDTTYNPGSNDNCFSAPTAASDILAGSAALAGGPGIDHDAAGKMRLAANGGPTLTAALLASSPALDHADAAACSSPAPGGPGGADQRGSPRFPDAITTCDIGAYEPEAVLALTGSASQNSGVVGQPLTFSFTIANQGPDASLLTHLTASPPGGSLGVLMSTQGSCGNLITSISCALGTLTLAGDASVSITVTPAAPGIYTTTATASNAESGSTAPLVLSVPVVGGAPPASAAPAAAFGPTPSAAEAGAAAAAKSKAAANAKCASLRQIKIHIQNVRRFHLVSARILVNGKAKATVKGKRLTAAVDLRGLPKGTVTITIIARQRNGRTIRGKRIYHTCRKNRLAGHKRLLL